MESTKSLNKREREREIDREEIDSLQHTGSVEWTKSLNHFLIILIINTTLQKQQKGFDEAC